MKISLNHIRFYQQKYKWSGDPAPDGADELVDKIGAQLAAVEEVLHPGDAYAGVMIVKVVECRKHENSDHLNVCQVDDGGITSDVNRGENGLVQVVCGAPNVKAGMTVAWLPPGSTVPSSFSAEPFVLSSRELRGEMSNGMLASPKELALGDSHDGILEIDEDITPGTKFAEYYGLAGDVVIDMENKMFTHRPDLFGVLGVAREIAGIYGQKFTSPDWYRSDVAIDAPEESSMHVEVRNEIPDLVPRFAVLPMAGITVKPSPVWLMVELTRLGIRPINNIVDLTNYYMLLTGQPLHAYDYDKLVALSGGDKASFVVRYPHDGEKLTLLSGKEIEPRTQAIMIATDQHAIGLGGVMGGRDTEVDDNTKNIVLECANFDMYSIRRTSMANGIFTDAVTRFNKGQSPLQNMAVLAKIATDVAKIAGGHVAGNVVDDNHVDSAVLQRDSINEPVQTTAGFINGRLGLDISVEEIQTLLENVEFSVTREGDSISVQAPFWRTDIEIPEDIVEEVGRLRGFDTLPQVLPRRDITPAVRNKELELKATVRDVLSRSGANEILTYSFVHGKLLQKAGQDVDAAYKLSNALSPELHYFRLSLTPSLLDKVHANIKAGFDEFVLFELGKSHLVGQADTAEPDIPGESNLLSLVYAAKQPRAGVAYYRARTYLDVLLAHFESSALIRYEPLQQDDIQNDPLLTQLTAPFVTGRSAVLRHVSGKIYGVVGEYKPTVTKAFKLPDYSAGFEVDPQMFVGSDEVSPYVVQSRFPKVWQDICLRVPSSVNYQTLFDFVRNEIHGLADAAIITSLSPVDIYQRPGDTDYKQITFRLGVASYDKTMTDTEVSAMLDTVSSAAADTLHAERV